MLELKDTKKNKTHNIQLITVCKYRNTQTHIDTQKTAKQPVKRIKTVEKTDDIKKTNGYLPNMLPIIILLQSKRLHPKLNFELCMSVLNYR